MQKIRLFLMLILLCSLALNVSADMHPDIVKCDKLADALSQAVPYSPEWNTILQQLVKCGCDHDGDMILDGLDNCIDVVNPRQIDSDLDGIGDACSGVTLIIETQVRLGDTTQSFDFHLSVNQFDMSEKIQHGSENELVLPNLTAGPVVISETRTSSEHVVEADCRVIRGVDSLSFSVENTETLHTVSFATTPGQTVHCIFYNAIAPFYE